MNKIYTLLSITALLCALSASAAPVEIAGGRIPVTRLDFARNGESLLMSMDLNLSSLELGKDKQITLTPVITSADSTETVEFSPVVIAGHNLYYKHLRDNDLDSAAALYKAGSVNTVTYSSRIPDASWIDESSVSIEYTVGGCCDMMLAEGEEQLSRFHTPVFTPQFAYVTPVGDVVKTRELARRSYVDFPVNKIVIYPEYRNNTVELSRIIATIDSVRADKDVIITDIFIKGFASPEGSYSHNTWLAQNRTEALRQYVEKLYSFEPGFIKTDFESEDWQGLRDYVAASELANRSGILALIDSDLEPDAKDARIKRDYPADYRFLLANVYPALRHSDYRIDYTIKSFTSLDDILRVLATEPQKLSLAEFYRAAQSMTPGSHEYNDVFETAVRMYPADPVANLNAANTAMQRGDLPAAARYLDKAGDDPSAVYARGILAALSGNYDEALIFFGQAARMKVADAPAAIESVKEIIAYRNGNVNAAVE